MKTNPKGIRININTVLKAFLVLIKFINLPDFMFQSFQKAKYVFKVNLLQLAANCKNTEYLSEFHVERCSIRSALIYILGWVTSLIDLILNANTSAHDFLHNFLHRFSRSQLCKPEGRVCVDFLAQKQRL